MTKHSWTSTAKLYFLSPLLEAREEDGQWELESMSLPDLFLTKNLDAATCVEVRCPIKQLYDLSMFIYSLF